MKVRYSNGKKYKVIAFVFSAFFKDEQLRIMRQMVTESRLHNCKVVFFSTLTDFYINDMNDEGEQKIFGAVNPERFDAIVLLSESFKQDEEQYMLAKRAEAAGVPVFTVDKSFAGCINLVMDYGECFKQIVEHMVRFHGYRRAYMMSGRRNNSFSQEREQAYLDVMQSVGVPREQCRIYYGDFWDYPCRIAMEEMFREIEEGLEMPEAIICANDAMAIEVCAFLKERGLRVPQDIAVSGYDGIEAEQYHNPRLTTGIYNINTMISTIFRILEEGCPAHYRHEKIRVSNEMRIGGSCGCDGQETDDVAVEIMALKNERQQLLKYQGNLNQMVVNSSTMKRLGEALSVVPQFMGSLGYRDFWFCANEGFMEEAFIDIAGQEREGTVQDYTSEMKVLWYHNIDYTGAEEGKAEIHNWTDMEFGELIPGLHSQLDENDFMLVNIMYLRGRSIGYTVVTLDEQHFWFTGYSIFLTNFRHLLELQWTQNQIVKMYMEDLLTGLYNRNGFYQNVNQLLDKSDDCDLSIISLDMDGLKQINDTYGHAEGDEALHNLGIIIKKSINHEIAARIGGDEFLIALTGRDIVGRTEEIVSCIKKGIREYNEVSGKDYELHASIGSYTNSIGNRSLDHFLKKADDLMYARKFAHKRQRGLIP